MLREELRTPWMRARGPVGATAPGGAAMGASDACERAKGPAMSVFRRTLTVLLAALTPLCVWAQEVEPTLEERQRAAAAILLLVVLALITIVALMLWLSGRMGERPGSDDGEVR